MHSHQHRILGVDVTHDHGEMHVTVDRVLESDRPESSIDRRQIGFDRSPHENFFLNPITDEIGDADDLQTMNDSKIFKLRQPRHRAIFIHDFTDNAGGIESSDACKIYRSLSLPRPHQHAAGFCSQRKYVPGAGEILWSRARIYRSKNGCRSVRGGNSGSYSPSRLDRNREGRAQAGSVIGNLWWQMQFIATFFRERQT